MWDSFIDSQVEYESCHVNHVIVLQVNEAFQIEVGGFNTFDLAHHTNDLTTFEPECWAEILMLSLRKAYLRILQKDCEPPTPALPLLENGDSEICGNCLSESWARQSYSKQTQPGTEQQCSLPMPICQCIRFIFHGSRISKHRYAINSIKKSF